MRLGKGTEACDFLMRVNPNKCLKARHTRGDLLRAVQPDELIRREPVFLFVSPKLAFERVDGVVADLHGVLLSD